MNRPHIPAFVAAACAALAVFATPAAAQSNTLFVEQAGVGNVISVDQSAALRSTMGSEEAPLSQSGVGNRLTIVDAGQDNVIPSVLQDNATGGNGLLPNVASITLGAGTGGAQASVTQNADVTGTLSGNNVAIIDLALGNGAAIVQNGTGNRADLTVNGPGASGTITQNGNRNEGALTVVGLDAAVSLTQTGNDLAFDSGATGVDFTNGAPGGISVVGNGVTVNIVQTAN